MQKKKCFLGILEGIPNAPGNFSSSLGAISIFRYYTNSFIKAILRVNWRYQSSSFVYSWFKGHIWVGSQTAKFQLHKQFV